MTTLEEPRLAPSPAEALEILPVPSIPSFHKQFVTVHKKVVVLQRVRTEKEGILFFNVLDDFTSPEVSACGLIIFLISGKVDLRRRRKHSWATMMRSPSDLPDVLGSWWGSLNWLTRWVYLTCFLMLLWRILQTSWARGAMPNFGHAWRECMVWKVCSWRLVRGWRYWLLIREGQHVGNLHPLICI